MASASLRKLAGSFLFRYNSLRRQSSSLLIASRKLSGKSESLNDGDGVGKSDVPLRYTDSKAEAWKARNTRSGHSIQEEPWYQMYVVMASLSVFMLYFFVLREENDIDQRLGSSLYDHIDGLEEAQLEMAIEYNRQNGISTKELVERLNQVKSMKSKQ